MKFATLCSGIGAPEVAAHRLGMEPVFCSEIEPFPCAASPPASAERLQGFPDNHTAVQYRNKPACDGPRYKALGNSMAVPCVQWVLKNLQKITQEKS